MKIWFSANIAVRQTALRKAAFALRVRERRCAMKKLSEKEALFCAYAAEGADPRGCAARAGYSVVPSRAAARLLAREDIRNRIKQLQEERQSCSRVESGLRKLAFGSSADAFKLLLGGEELSAEDIERLDLFNVSDIKKPKGGGLEIKFYDRLKAMERLAALGGGVEAAQSSFAGALMEGARLLGGEAED